MTTTPLFVSALLIGLTAFRALADPAHALDFLAGRWNLRVARDADVWLDGDSALTALCTSTGDGLECDLSLGDGERPVGSLTAHREAESYAVELVVGTHTLRGGGRLQRPDTFVVDGTAAERPLRLWLLSPPPGRRLLFYLETRPASGAPEPLFEAGGGLEAELPAPPPGRSPGERSILLQAVIEAPVAEVFRAFVDTERANRFFGLEARIDGRVGEPYEIGFLPASHPQSLANSSSGARLLAREENRRLSFEWAAPPMVAHLNTDPLPTWVDVTFEEAPGPAGATRVRIEHHGFLRGEDWDFDYEFLTRGWSNILWRLQQAARSAHLD